MVVVVVVMVVVIVRNWKDWIIEGTRGWVPIGSVKGRTRRISCRKGRKERNREGRGRFEEKEGIAMMSSICVMMVMQQLKAHTPAGAAMATTA